MKGKIDKNGCLEVERAGVFKSVYCPHEEGDTPCADHCALFYDDVFQENQYVKLCNGSIFEIEGDER